MPPHDLLRRRTEAIDFHQRPLLKHVLAGDWYRESERFDKSRAAASTVRKPRSRLSPSTSDCLVVFAASYCHRPSSRPSSDDHKITHERLVTPVIPGALEHVVQYCVHRSRSLICCLVRVTREVDSSLFLSHLRRSNTSSECDYGDIDADLGGRRHRLSATSFWCYRLRGGGLFHYRHLPNVEDGRRRIVRDLAGKERAHCRVPWTLGFSAAVSAR